MGLLVLALVGLAIGIWLGLPGRYDQTPEDLERLMAQGGGARRRRPKRSISPVAWLQRKLTPGGPAPSRRRGFKLEAPGTPAQRPPLGGAEPRAPRLAREAHEDEPGSPRKPRKRQNLREGRFKLRPPGEGGSR